MVPCGVCKWKRSNIWARIASNRSWICLRPCAMSLAETVHVLYNRRMVKIAAILFGITSVLCASTAAERLEESALVLREIMGTSDRSIPQDLLDKAHCLIVVPGLKKGAFIVGAKYGRGFMSCRKGHVGWSAPAGVRMEGGSVGFQIGGS